ncbi:MAG TPA: MFS transporter [Coleofasciculaceae cyanobacterium]
MLPAFQSRNYRLYFMGQGLSLTGTWMTQLATVWLVYHLTQSPLLLGLVSFISQLPNLVLVPFGGVLVDRWNHHRTMLITQTLAMLQSLALAILTLTGSIQVWQILALAFCQGLINAVDSPTRQAFLPEMVERKENLVNAIALNSSMVNGAKLLGPAIGGLVIASVGAGYCFLIDGFSYLAVLVSLLAMQIPPKPLNSRKILSHPPILKNLQEGLVYAFGFPPIRSTLLLVALVSFMGLSPTVVLPVVATEVFGGSAHILGILMAAPGIGALIGAISLTQRQGIRGLGRLMAIAPIILGVSMIAFSQSKTLWLSTLLLILIGFGTLLQTAASNTVIQTLVEDDKRGRVMSLYLVAFLGIGSLGNLFTGSLMSLMGAAAEVALSGGICILGAILFAQQLPKLRRLVWATDSEQPTAVSGRSAGR